MLQGLQLGSQNGVTQVLTSDCPMDGLQTVRSALSVLFSSMPQGVKA